VTGSSAASRTGTAWTEPAPGGPPPEGGRADVVVVGAGVVGLSLATQLAERGADVRVVARHPVGEGITGRSSAKVTALHQVAYSQLARRHGAEAAATYAAACTAALDWVRAHGGDAVTACDALTVARDAREQATLAEEAEAAAAAGLDVRLEDGPASFPGAVAGLRLADQAQVDPVALVRGLAERLPHPVAQGVVTSVRERPGQATVSGTTDGRRWSVRAPHVVIATGLPTLDRGGFFALVEPKASYLVAVRQDPSQVPDRPEALITAGEPTRSVRWILRDGHDPLLLVGGEGHRTGASTPTAPKYTTLERWARDTYQGLGEVVARWSAEDFSSADLLPFAGPQHRFGGPVHVVTGMRKWGFTLGVACATALTARLCDDRTTDFGALVDPARLPDAQGVAEVVRAQVDVGAHMVRGYARAAVRRPEPVPGEGEGVVGRCGAALRATSTVGGRVRTLSAVCTHLGGVVCWNDGDGTWDCPLHGSRYEADGTVRHSPAVRDLRAADGGSPG
jgi:glycine/D-amino acid oxidase-like deaminating enzyme/nitrite reductase/ring-hydroxylating ferredoxin subunit